MARKRGRITIQSQPTVAGRTMRRLMGVVHAIFGGVFVIVALTTIMPNAGIIGLPFLAAGLFFCINGIRMVVTKNDIAHRVGYDVETDLDRSIAGLMEEVPDTTQEILEQPEAAAAPAGTVQDRLEQLKELYGQELITKEEYDAKRQEILDEL